MPESTRAWPGIPAGTLFFTERDHLELIDGEIVTMTPILNENAVWRYSSPERGSSQRVEAYRHGQTIVPLALPQCAIAVDDVLTE